MNLPPAARALLGRDGLLAALAFALCLTLAVRAWQHAEEEAVRAQALELQARFETIRESLESRMQSYEQVLRGAVGMMHTTAAGVASRRQWQTYVADLRLAEHFPGIQGVGFAQRIDPADLEAHLLRVRAEGYPDYSVRPSGERAEYTSIIYLEPFVDRNLRAFGYDMASEPVRREAMHRARDGGQASLSGRVTLVQETESRPQAGVLLYLPLYRAASVPVAVAPRRAALIGYVYSPFRMNDLATAALGPLHGMRVRIHDGAGTGDESLLYDSHEGATGGADERKGALVIAGRTWTITVSRLAPSATAPASAGLRALGVLLSFAIALLVFVLLRAKARAEGMVNERTEALAASDERFRALAGLSSDWYWELDSELRFERTSHGERTVPTAWIGLHPWEVPGLKVQERDAESLSALLKSRRPFRGLILEHPGPDTDLAYSSIGGEPKLDSRGHFAGYRGVGHDISTARRTHLDLRETAARLRSVLDSAGEAIVIIDRRGTIETFNMAAERMFGYAKDEVIGRSISTLIPERFLDAEEGYLDEADPSLLATVIDRGARELVGQRKDSSTFPIEVSLSESRLESGQKFVSIVRDLTARKLVDSEIHATNATLKRTVAALEARNAEGALLNELGELLQTCNSTDEILQLLPHYLGRLVPGTVIDIHLADEAGEAFKRLARHGESGGAPGFHRQQCWALRRGRPHGLAHAQAGIRCAHIARPTPGGTLCLPMLAQQQTVGLMSVHHPEVLTEAERARIENLVQRLASQLALSLANIRLRESLGHEAVRDPLTGLFNRRYLDETLRAEMARVARSRRPLAALMIDVDHFKRVNDTHGHDVGDRVLRALAQLLKERVRPGDIACRHGGEEFLVLMPEAECDTALARAEALRDEASRLARVRPDLSIPELTLSIGVAVAPAHAASAEALLRCADAALYRAKESGRNRVEAWDAAVPAAAAQVRVVQLAAG